MSTMKTKWGFSSVLINSDGQYTEADNAGFSNDDMVGKVTVYANNFIFPFKPEKRFNRYFIDEPEESSIPVTVMYTIASYFSSQSLILSSYKIGWILDPLNYTVNYYNNLISGYSNIRIMSDNYYDWDCSYDQRGYWDDFKDEYGNRNIANFTSLIIDKPNNEFSGLFQKTSSLGMNSIWLYIGNGATTTCGGNEVMNQSIFDSYLREFLSAAKWKGWLTQFDRLYRFEYSCPTANPCITCDQNNISEVGGWVLDEVIKTDLVEEWDESHWVETTQ